MHFLSDHEYAAFLEAWWDELVTDIREQYPLNLQRTLSIAGQMGVKHPIDSHTGLILTQTTDFLLTKSLDENAVYTAWAVKDKNKLIDERTMVKLEIERRYWREEGVHWVLIVNDGMNSYRALNLDWLFNFELMVRGNVRPDKDCVLRVLAAVRDGYPEPAGVACRHLDVRYDSVVGAHVTALRFLFLTRILRGDLEADKLTNQSIRLFEVRR
jgi:hypothetical protein